MYSITAILFVSIAVLAESQYCPDYNLCNGCEPSWTTPPVISIDYTYVSSGVCTVTLKWDYPYSQSDNKINPRMIFVCTYADDSSCGQNNQEDYCASCEEAKFPNLQSSKEPYITYSDTCGKIKGIPIDMSKCQDVVEPTTVNPDATTAVPDITTTTSTTTTTTTTGSTSECINNFVVMAGKCILVEPYLDETWAESKNFCERIGSRLVSIDSDELYMDIISHIYSQSLEQRDFWVGAQKSNGIYYWLDGNAMETGTPYWAIDGVGDGAYAMEPNSEGIPNYDCIRMESDRFLYYDDIDCGFMIGLICEHDLS